MQNKYESPCIVLQGVVYLYMSNEKNENKMKDQILNIFSKMNKQYNHSNVTFEDLKNKLGCTDLDLILFLNGCSDSRIVNRVTYK